MEDHVGKQQKVVLMEDGCKLLVAVFQQGFFCIIAYMCVCVCMRTCMCVSMCMRVCVCVCVCVHVCVCVCVCVCVYVCWGVGCGGVGASLYFFPLWWSVVMFCAIQDTGLLLSVLAFAFVIIFSLFLLLGFILSFFLSCLPFFCASFFSICCCLFFITSPLLSPVFLFL